MGSEGVREFRSHELDTGATVRWEPLEVLEVDDSRVIAVNRVHMRGPGVYVEDTDAQLWELRNGKAAGITLYRSKEEALEAAGVQE